LRAIAGFVQAIEEDCAPLLDDQGRRYLGLVRDNAEMMGQLIDNLLDFSRMSRRQMKETAIDLAELATVVFDEQIAQLGGRDVRLALRAAPPVRGDKDMLRQVLVNLLSNALKFTRPRERALIEFGYDPSAAGGAYYVKDNGVGFDMRYVDKLFGVFQRLHAASDFEGTGVGLALVQRIVGRHGGRIWADGAVDQGATFYFTLPQGDGQ
jgi:two-component system sensor kinase